MPELRTVRHFHDDAAYIDALAHKVEAHWQVHGRPEKLLMSFHGVPRFTLDKGDPYHCECLKTGRLLAEKLGLNQEQYVVSFQSRFGRAEWMQPYTSATLEQLGKKAANGWM
jgi:ferrochelatase